MRSFSSTIQGIDNALARLRAGMGWPYECNGVATAHQAVKRDPADILLRHKGCPESHINHTSLRDTIHHLDGRPAAILETGSSAWGTNSTCLWDAYVQEFGGRVWSVDIRRTPSRQLRRKVSAATTLVADDSVAFLERWARNHSGESVSLVYLDSWDLVAQSPMPAAIHCLREYEAIRRFLRGGALLLVDDTPGSKEWLTTDLRDEAINYRETTGLWPGKGMLLDLVLEQHPRVTKLHHRYQTLYRFD